MSKFTDGEWYTYNTDKALGVGSYGFEICKLNYNHDCVISTAENEANANLIAAAPDMYAMLESMYETLCLIGDDGEEVEEIKLLLTKARGEIK